MIKFLERRSVLLLLLLSLGIFATAIWLFSLIIDFDENLALAVALTLIATLLLSLGIGILLQTQELRKTKSSVFWDKTKMEERYDHVTSNYDGTVLAAWKGSDYLVIHTTEETARKGTFPEPIDFIIIGFQGRVHVQSGGVEKELQTLDTT